ncbi:MAG: hypothetical protein KY460_07930 [Actinobacteria bacterium]|nr:hypothetical protein [Actinomycetota bacterium]
MIRLGRMLAVTLLLTALMSGVALAGESDDHPLADLPKEYAPALDAAASQLGVSSADLTSASRDELESLLCSKLEKSSAEEIAAGAKQALADAPEEQLKDLSEAQRAQLEARLPSIIAELESEYCATSATADDHGDSDSDDDGSSAGSDSGTTTSESGIPVPTRVDTGGGGAADGLLVPAAFGGLFAALFGLFGVGMMRRQHDT